MLLATHSPVCQPTRRGCVTRVAQGSTLGAPPAAPISPTSALQHREAHAAFTASLEKVLAAHKGVPVRHREHAVLAQVALQSSSAARLARQTHLNTLNMSSMEEEATAGAAAEGAQQQQQLPLSQLAFKALLRASLAAARLQHGYLTTPHLLLGLIAAGSTSLTPAAAGSIAAATDTPTPPTAATIDSSSSSSASLAAAAEAAVVRLIDGPAAAGGQQRAVAGAAAAASLLGRSCGLDVVTWVHRLSGPARQVLLQAEELRRQQGHSLLTSHHLLAAMLHPSSSSRTVVTQLLAELQLDLSSVSGAVQSGLAAAAAADAGSVSSSDNSTNSAAAAAAAFGEDGVLCEPLGFLHEAFYGSLCAELLPAAAHRSSSSSSIRQDTPCLN